MKIRLILIACFFNISLLVSSQLPVDVYRKPLKEVLTDIERRYNIKFQYNEAIVKGLEVTYATWRYRIDTEETLSNILLPMDLVFEKTDENTYQITRFSYYQRTPEEGKRHLDKLLESYKSLQVWEARKAELRKCFLEQLNLSPMPRKTPLNPVVTAKRKYDGYTIENVGIETIPGFYLCGSLYRPVRGKGPFPAVLSPHGHFNSADLNENGRYRPDQQIRCAMLAKMGAVVFSYEMFGYGESLLQITPADHRTSFSSTMQTLNSIRVIDFLTSLPYVDPSRIGVTGESGGGTQTFLLTAIDDRVTVSVPVVMVSSYYQGGCACESGLPIHSCTDLMTNNVEIAAMASPRPLLVISDGQDWTRHTPEIEFPYLQKVYALYGKQENVKNVHLPDEGHDYGVSKRMPMYDFMARHLGLNLKAVQDKAGRIDESKVTIEKYDAQLVFGKEGKLPENALKGLDKIKGVLKTLQ
ncbi:MAG TPA: acetylxylan esterase [Bacteroidales bacterium]|nr:acetylxylan esterase [Bacteroidales bacterium]